MTGENPPGPKIVGVLLIIFGFMYSFFGIIFGLFSFGTSVFFNSLSSFGGLSGAEEDSFTKVFADVKFISSIQGIETFLAGVISIAALAAGIGLVQYKEKTGRKLSLAWGCIALAYLAIDAVIYFVVIVPLQSDMMLGMSQLSGSGISGWLTNSGVVLHIISLVCLAVLPILTIAMMTRPSAKESCKV
ncbi:MAG: hypothetical protein GY754_10765 [bacterium]|nr:hypothetical protein [bacterium]